MAPSNTAGMRATTRTKDATNSPAVKATITVEITLMARDTGAVSYLTGNLRGDIETEFLHVCPVRLSVSHIPVHRLIERGSQSLHIQSYPFQRARVQWGLAVQP